jgi:hypothetical protein
LGCFFTLKKARNGSKRNWVEYEKLYRIKQEIEELIDTEIEVLLNTPGKENVLLD